MGSLVQTREELERRVDDLRAFEREYRSRLKAYLEGQLRDLEAGVTDSGDLPVDGFGLATVDAARAGTERRAQRWSGHGSVRSLRGSAALRWFPQRTMERPRASAG